MKGHFRILGFVILGFQLTVGLKFDLRALNKTVQKDYAEFLNQDFLTYNSTYTGEELKELLEWKIPENFKARFPFYHSGYDYEDRAVMIIEYGKWDTKAIADKGGENLKILEKIVDQYVERIRASWYSKQNENFIAGTSAEEMCVIIDVRGLNGLKLLNQFYSSANTKHFIRTFAKLYGGYDKFAYGYLVNTDAVIRELLTLVKPWAQKLMEKTEIFGTIPSKWKPHILRRIPHDQLPPAYGGTKDFQPVAYYGK